MDEEINSKLDEILSAIRNINDNKQLKTRISLLNVKIGELSTKIDVLSKKFNELQLKNKSFALSIEEYTRLARDGDVDTYKGHLARINGMAKHYLAQLEKEK